jgi:hypothetical protein
MYSSLLRFPLRLVPGAKGRGSRRIQMARGWHMPYRLGKKYALAS